MIVFSLSFSSNMQPKLLINRNSKGLSMQLMKFNLTDKETEVSQEHEKCSKKISTL